MILVTEDKVETYPIQGNEYRYVEMTNGKHSALVVICKGHSNYVRVMVQNASNRAWRGMGKCFADAEAAVANYKTSAIREMIQFATAS